MDVDKLQRINNLARELMKHGMAASMDEAVRIAEDKIKGNAEVSNIQNTMSGDVLSQSQVSQSSETLAPAPKVHDEMELRRLKNTMDEQSRLVNSMGGKINELIAEFNKMQQELNRLKTIQVPSQQAADKPAKGTQTQFRPQADDKKEPHARTGSYKPDDVAVEKVFYYGNR